MLFDDAMVHEFDFTFYTEHWTDSLEYAFANDEEYIPVRVTYRGIVFDSVGIRYKGNSSLMQSRNTPKKPFKLKFDEYRSKQSCFGVTRLNFSNGVKDPSFMREKLSYDILRTLLPSPRAAFATLSVNGDLLGLYTQVEQVDKKFLARHFKSNDYNLYKASDNGATLEFRGGDKAGYYVEYELKTNEKADDWSRLIAMLDRLNHTPSSEVSTTLATLLDLDNSIRLTAFNVAASNFDSYTGSSRNFYLYDDETSGRFVFIPWDPNESFGAYANNWNVITQDVLGLSNLDKRPLTRRMFENDSLRDVYLEYIRSLAHGALSLDSLSERVFHWKAFLDPWVRADRNKLYTYQNFVDNIDKDVVVGINMTIPGLLRFARQRNEQLLAQVEAYYGQRDGTPIPANPIPVLEYYPNPVSTSSVLRFRLLYGGNIVLRIGDALGRTVLDVDLGERTAGIHEVESVAASLPSGMYVWALTLRFAGSATYTSSSRKMLVLR